MIRINLASAAVERATKPVSTAPPVNRIAIAASLLLTLTVLGLGAWFWSLRQQSATLDRDIAQTDSAARDLQSVLGKVQGFEARKAQLQLRVTLIDRLRTGQSAPVRVLDQISRSVPDRLWLDDMTQAGSDFTIAGFASSMTALTDFVAGIEATRWFRTPVEIIDSQVTSDPKTGELVRFVVKAGYVDRDAPAPPVPSPAEKAK